MSGSNMTKRLGIILITFMVLSLLLAAFLLLNEKGTKTPEIIAIQEVIFEEIQDNNLGVRVKLLLKNPNQIDMTLTNIDAQVFIEDENIGVVREDKRHRLNGKEITTLSLSSQIDISKFAGIFPSLLNKDKTNLVVKGIFGVDAIVKDIQFKRATDKQISVRPLLNKIITSKIRHNGIKLEKITPKSIGLFSTSFYLGIEIRNDFGVEYEVNTIDCDLFLPDSNSAFGKWQYNGNRLTVEPNTKQSLSGEIIMANDSVLVGLTGAVLGADGILAKCNTDIKMAQFFFSIPFEKLTSIENIIGG